MFSNVRSVIVSIMNHVSRREKLRRFKKHVNNLYHESELEEQTENESHL